MEACQGVDGFDLDDNSIVDEQIDPVTGIQTHALIGDGKAHPTSYGDASRLELMSEAVLVRRFEESGPKRSVDGEAGIDDEARQRLQAEPWRLNTFVFFVSFVHFVFNSGIDGHLELSG
jgi:hypothetical protein